MTARPPQARAPKSKAPPLPDSRAISRRIAAPFAAVCAFLSDPGNWPRWAEGLGSLSHDAGTDTWTTRSPDGRIMRVTFSPPNTKGIFDHTVYPPADESGRAAPPIHVPLRAEPDGAEATLVTLTLIRQPGMDDVMYERDAAWVEKDLERLGRALENRPAAA
ncbi:SRPBCC family protein [Ferrovibrio sp.]|uniref:SRPBCC family protein n=1 Tax=Ferrovibrio sp. TaxID=1917215 RepID=UPI00312010F1